MNNRKERQASFFIVARLHDGQRAETSAWTVFGILIARLSFQDICGHAAAMTGAQGTSLATNNATLTRPMATSDLVRLRMKKGILNGASIETVCKKNTAIKYGAGLNAKICATSKTMSNYISTMQTTETKMVSPSVRQFQNRRQQCC